MSNKKVRVAIVGVGNCANALVQGVTYYQDAPHDAKIPGLMHSTVGGYHISDIEFTAAFDVSVAKVGLDLSEAIWAEPNNTIRFAEVPFLDVPVYRGATLDGLGYYVNQVVNESSAPTVDVEGILRDTKTDVVVNYLPVGSQAATEYYAEQLLAAGCGFVNGIPVFIATNEEWAERFRQAGLPLIGDDIKSQVGATITHRVLTNLFEDRGVRLDRTYQLNFGGNMDFYNMLERQRLESKKISKTNAVTSHHYPSRPDQSVRRPWCPPRSTYQLNFGGNMDFYNMLERQRLESKKISKTNAVTSQLTHELGDDNVHVGPSDYVPWLTDRKWCHIRMEGRAFGEVPLQMELKLEVWDSPNSAGVIIDAARCAKIAMDRGLRGPITAPSSYFMKSPPIQYTDDEARGLVEEFIAAEPTPESAQ